MPRKPSFSMDAKGHVFASYPSDRVDVKIGQDGRKVDATLSSARAKLGGLLVNSLAPRTPSKTVREPRQTETLPRGLGKAER